MQVNAASFRILSNSSVINTPHRLGWEKGTPPGMYPGGAHFETWLEHRLSCLKFLVVFLSFSRQILE
jgi:hypothetical protein